MNLFVKSILILLIFEIKIVSGGFLNMQHLTNFCRVVINIWSRRVSERSSRGVWGSSPSSGQGGSAPCRKWISAFSELVWMPLEEGKLTLFSYCILHKLHQYSELFFSKFCVLWTIIDILSCPVGHLKLWIILVQAVVKTVLA